MTSFNESLSEQVSEAFCSMLGTINNFNDWFSGLPFGDSNLTNGIARTAYRNLCNREPPPPPPPLVPGGQCVGVNYRWQVSYEKNTSPSGENWVPETRDNFSNFSTAGPIGALRVITQTATLVFDSGDVGGVTIVSQYGMSGENRFRNYKFEQIFRSDGQPDTCGEIPGPVPSPSPNYNEGNRTVTYNDNSNNSVDVDVSITIGSPSLRVDGDINIPVRILSPDINIPITGNFSINNPKVEFNFGDQNYTPNNSPNGSDYDTSDDTPEPPPDVPVPVQPTNPDEPDVETRRVIRGVIVTVQQYPSDFGILFQNDNPDIAIPNFGYISFLCQIGSRAAWTIDLPVKNRRNLIECPWFGGAIAVRGTPRPGVDWVLSEVYAVSEETVSFEV